MAEVVVVFAVYHNHCFSSDEGLNIQLPEVFSDSKIESKFSSARMKSPAVIYNVIAPFTITETSKSVAVFNGNVS